MLTLGDDDLIWMCKTRRRKYYILILLKYLKILYFIWLEIGLGKKWNYFDILIKFFVQMFVPKVLYKEITNKGDLLRIRNKCRKKEFIKLYHLSLSGYISYWIIWWLFFKYFFSFYFVHIEPFGFNI